MTHEEQYKKLIGFINRIETKDNARLMEAIKGAAKVCFEGIPGRDGMMYQPMKAVIPLSTPFMNKEEEAEELEHAEHEANETPKEEAAEHEECDNCDQELVGGEGDATDITTLDPTELGLGIQHELKEHSRGKKDEDGKFKGGNVEAAIEIATDHLTENPKYYSELIAKMSGEGDPEEVEEELEEKIEDLEDAEDEAENGEKEEKKLPPFMKKGKKDSEEKEEKTEKKLPPFMKKGKKEEKEEK